jgi:putative SOS response-associated peptidase YedK
MCYSAQILHDYRKYVRLFGADISLREFYELFWRRVDEPALKLPKAMEAAFLDPSLVDVLPPGSQAVLEEIRERIAAFGAREAIRLEQELFAQRRRLADAQRKLAAKPTKTAAESERIATAKIDWALGKLSDLKRTQHDPEDDRIFPAWYVPVLVMEGGRRVVRPMRYQCRLPGKPASHDAKFPGTYNARRDSLEGFWKPAFGVSHGVVLASAFFENVKRHRVEGRELRPAEKEENVVLEFRPRPGGDMLVACLWSRWKSGESADEPDLLSFAAITDEPPPEIAAAGHDRCIIPIKAEHLDTWLNPDRRDLAAQYAVLDDRERPYYEHRLAA